MAVPHARSGEVINVQPLGSALSTTGTRTLVKTETLEIVRLVVPAGKVHKEHRVPGEITVQCLEGKCAFTAAGSTRELEAGHLLYLAGGEPHSLRAVEDCSLLLTILLVQPNHSH